MANAATTTTELLRLRLRKLDGPTWPAMRALASVTWAWNDLESGLNIAARLPDTPPPGLTLLHGWASGRWLRVRVDPALPNGLAGAELVNDQEPGQAVEAVVGVPDGTALVHVPGERTKRSVRLLTVTHQVAAGERARTTFIEFTPLRQATGAGAS